MSWRLGGKNQKSIPKTRIAFPILMFLKTLCLYALVASSLNTEINPNQVNSLKNVNALMKNTNKSINVLLFFSILAKKLSDAKIIQSIL